MKKYHVEYLPKPNEVSFNDGKWLSGGEYESRRVAEQCQASLMARSDVREARITEIRPPGMVGTITSENILRRAAAQREDEVRKRSGL